MHSHKCKTQICDGSAPRCADLPLLCNHGGFHHGPSGNGDLQQLAWVPTHQSCRIYFTQIKIGIQKFSPNMRKLQLMHIPSLLGVPCIYGGDLFSILGQLECLARLTISAKNLAVEGCRFP